MSKRYNISGLSGNVELGKGGSRLKISGTDLQARNAADGAFVNFSGLDATAATHFVTKSQLDAAGSTNIYTADGALAGARAVTFGANDLTFSGTGTFVVDTTTKFLQNTPTVGYVATATNADGSWTWQAAAGGGNTIYSADDSLAGNRIVTLGTNTLTFAGTGLTTFAANVTLNGTANKFLQNTPTVGQVPTATAVDGAWTWQDNSATNIYIADGSLTANRTMTMGAFRLTFTGTGDMNFSSTGTHTFVGNAYLNGTANRFLQNTPAVGQVPTATAVDGSWTWQTASGGSTRLPQNGVISEAIQFFVDFNNTTSWTPNQTTTWTDVIGDTAGTTTSTSIVAGHLNFNTAGAASKVDFGTIPAAVANNWTGGGTAAGWIRPESDGAGNTGRLYDTSQTGSAGTLCYLSNEAGGLVSLNIWVRFASGWGQWKSTALDITLAEWNHWAITFDSDSPGTAPVLYVNGSSVAVTSTTVPSGAVTSDAANNLIVGNNSASARAFDGDIEVFGMWNAVLTAAEIADLYRAQAHRFVDAATSPTWAQTLISGNISGGTDPVLTLADTFRGPDAAANFSATDFNIRGANSTSSHGQTVVITGGSTAFNGSSAGGVDILGGTGTASNNPGGDVNIIGGSSTFASPGDITITGGAVSTTGVSSSGAVSITTGANAGTTLGNTSGALALGTGTSLGQTGGVTIVTGDNISAVASNNQIGSITIQTGLATSTTTWTGGGINIKCQGDTSGGTSAINGGDVVITSGNTGLINQDAGQIHLLTGYTYGSNAAQGGHIKATLGKEVNGSSVSALGGSFLLTPGSSGSYEDGGFHLFPVDGTFGESPAKFTAEGNGTVAVPSGGATVTLGTISHDMSTNDRVQIFTIQVTGTLSTGGEFRGLEWSVMVSRTSGVLTVTNVGGLSTASVNSTYGMGSGAGFGANIMFQVNTATNAVVLQALSGAGAYTGHFAWNVRRQLGGAAS